MCIRDRSKVNTGLEPVAGQQFTFKATDFDVLFDSPIEVGNQDVFEFNAAGVRHEVTMVGGGNSVSYTHLDVYKRQSEFCLQLRFLQNHLVQLHSFYRSAQSSK